MATELLNSLEGGLIASCQPVRGGVFDRPDLVALFARAAQAGGSAGLRIEGLADARAVREVTSLPIIGLVKRTIAGSDVFITPEIRDVEALARTGVEVIAFDATDRARPAPVEALVGAIHAAGCLAMADIATPGEGVKAHELGVDFVGTTLSGYTPDSPALDGPDLDLVSTLHQHGARVIAEGRIATPAQAAEAIRLGAYAVTVGTAITRPELITQAFVEAIGNAAPPAPGA